MGEKKRNIHSGVLVYYLHLSCIPYSLVVIALRCGETWR
jgi:hypothetical protein